MSESAQTLSLTTTKEREAYYGVTGAALRKWRSKGEQAGDPFPEENPAEVVEWYARNYTKSAPQSLLLAAAKFTAPEKKRRPGKLEEMDPGGLAESLERARRVEAYYGRLLEEALRNKDVAGAEALRGPWLKAQAAVKDLEKAAVDIAKKKRELIVRNEVVAAWQSMHGHLPRAISRALLEAKPDGLTDEDWSATVRQATDKAMDLMQVQLPEILAGSPAGEAKPEAAA